MESFSWTCPICGRDTTITAANCSRKDHYLEIGNAEGSIALETVFIVCPNKECRKTALTAELYEYAQRFRPHVGAFFEKEKKIA